MTEKEVKSLLRKNHRTWSDFIKWMRGQTVGMDENGETNWYEWDVERFINNRPIID